MTSKNRIVMFNDNVPQIRIKSFIRYRGLPVIPLNTGWQSEKGWLRAENWDNRNRIPLRDPDKKFVLVQYTLSGSAVFNSNAGEHNLKAGELFIAPIPSESSYYLPKTGNWEWLWISATGTGLYEWSLNFTAENGFIHTIDPNDNAIKKLASIYREHVLNRTPPPEELSSQIYTFFTSLAKTVKTNQKKTSTVESALQYIEAYFNEPGFNVAELADMCKLSREYFSRAFKKQTGISPGKAIENKRMQHARELTWSCNQTVREIAEQSGYRHLSHFCATFRSHYGTTPGKLMQ